MQPTPIDDPGDIRIAAYRDIRERDLVGRRRLFIAEGKVVLNILLSADRFEAKSVLVLENRLTGIGEILRGAPPDMPVYVASKAVMDAVAGFPMHRGILAVGRRRTAASAAALLGSLPERALVLVLVGISNHDNVGAIFRNAAAFGADAVFLDPTCCDPLYRKAIRVSVGGVFRTPYAAFDDLNAFMAALAGGDFRFVALSPRGSRDVRETARSNRMALFLGSEGDGLPMNLLSRLDSVRITMAQGFDSLNVAAASAIALHQLAGAPASVG